MEKSKWQVGQRWVSATHKRWGVGVVRYVDGGVATIRWADGDVVSWRQAAQDHLLSPAPDYPRVYVVKTGGVWVWLGNERGVRLDYVVRCAQHSDSGFGNPCANGTWDHHEITGTPEADEFIRQAEAYFAEKDKPAPAPLATPGVERLAKVLVDFADAVGGEHNRVGLAAAQAFAEGIIDAINTLPGPKPTEVPLPTPEEVAAAHILEMSGQHCFKAKDNEGILRAAAFQYKGRGGMSDRQALETKRGMLASIIRTDRERRLHQ